jgi:putative nucleotidyltransferase with HDIG domain
VKPSFSILRGTVAKRILGLFLLCALLPIGSLAVLSLWEMSVSLKEQTDRQLHHASKNVNMAILQSLYSLQTELEVRALSPGGLLRHSSGASERAPIPGQDRHFLGLTLFREGALANPLFGRPCPLPPMTDGIASHLAAGKAYVFVREVPGTPPRVYMAVSSDRRMPVESFLVGEIHPGYLREIIESVMPAETDLAILDATGAALFRSRPVPAEVVRRVGSEMERNFYGQFEWRGEGDTVLVNYRSIFMQAPYFSGDWAIVVSQSRADAFAVVTRFTKMFVLIIVLTLLVILLLSIVQIRRKLDPLGKLREGTRKIGEGNFGNRIEIATGDEFEDLAHSFNTMAERLGKEFHALTETGRIVRSVLTALEKGTIVKTVLSSLRNVVPCKTVGISLFDPGGNGTGQAYGDRLDTGDPDDLPQSPVVLTPEEMQMLREADEGLIVKPGSDFQGLLSPLSGNGARRFVLLPFLHKKQLAGVIAMGFGEGTGQGGREGLLRARQIADQVAIALANAGLLEELAQLNWGAMTALARTVDAKSPWTAGHSERVTEFALMIGREMGLGDQEIDLLQRGGLLHDIGKIGVPGTILDKPGKLTPEEFAIIRSHPGKGSRILEPIPAFREIIPIVLEHHEKFNGSGYPRGLSGEAISLGARILAVADVYDALSADRPYRPAHPQDKVLAIIEEGVGRHFDPVVVQAFRKIIPSGEEATICREGRPEAIVGQVPVSSQGIDRSGKTGRLS